MELGLELQTDAWNCGVWLYAFVELLIAYIDSDSFRSSSGWRGFAASRDDFTPIAGLRAEARAVAVRQNTIFIDRKREELRMALQTAADADASPLGAGATARLPLFARTGHMSSIQLHASPTAILPSC